MTTILVFIVQMFYINTVRARASVYLQVHRNSLILDIEVRAPVVVVLLLFGLSLTALVTGLMLTVVQLKIRIIAIIVFDPLNTLAFNIARSTALICDMGVVIALCWLLRSRKRNIAKYVHCPMMAKGRYTN
jgi:hypothetical protein